MIVSTAVSVGALGAIMKPLVSELIGYVKHLSKDPAKIASKSLSAADIGRAVYNVISVKTLWNIDKEVSLFEFYHPARISIDSTTAPVVFKDINTLPSGNNYVIQGTAGQGKSILLRYLYGQMAFSTKTERKLPLFIELRRLTETRNFAALLSDELERIGLPNEESLFSYYFKSNNITLLLDAFDEINPNYVQDTISSIENIASEYPEVQILVSARPDSEIQKSPLFRVVKIDPLRSDDHQPFLEKVCANKAQADAIKSAIDLSENGLENLLSTPLLLTLLVLLYRAQSSIPSTVARFYEQLFDVLFLKHDQTKPGFHRTRFTSLDETQLKTLFEAFAFSSQLGNRVLFTDSEFALHTQEAIEICGIDVQPASFRKELVKTACLMIEDGPETSFVHKSVAEFYAAVFVQRSDLSFAQDFYQQITQNLLHQAWSGELIFLKEIDSYRFSRYFLIPEIELVLERLEGQDLLDSKLRIDKWIEDWLDQTSIKLSISKNHGLMPQGIVGGKIQGGHFDFELFVGVFSVLLASVFGAKDFDKEVYADGKEVPNTDPIQREFSARILNPLLNITIEEKIREKIQSIVDRLKNDLDAAKKTVEREVSKKKLVPRVTQKTAKN